MGGASQRVVDFPPSLFLRSATGLAFHFLRWDASDSAPILPNATGEDADVDERDAGETVCVKRRRYSRSRVAQCVVRFRVIQR